jgi:hypothetical protein
MALLTSILQVKLKQKQEVNINVCALGNGY